jgi:endonuclease YncB( thermonuclease family)
VLLRSAPSLGLALALTAAFALGAAAGAIWAPATRSIAAPPPAPSSLAGLRLAPGGHAVDVLRVNDGDTFEARVHVWPGIQITTKVRLRGIDAAEFKARCPDELRQAEAARDALRKLLAEGGVTIGRIAFDKYGGRVVADAATQASGDVSAALLRAGLVRGYDGGRRESWCTQMSVR